MGTKKKLLVPNVKHVGYTGRGYCHTPCRPKNVFCCANTMFGMKNAAYDRRFCIELFLASLLSAKTR